MGFDNVTFWLFLAAVIVASLTFVTIVVWAENRLKERQEFYRFEFRKRLVEAGKMDAGVDRLEMGRTPTSGVLLTFGALSSPRRPVAEEAAQGDDLTDVVGVVIGDQQSLAQQRLAVAPGELDEEVARRILNQVAHRLEVPAKSLDAGLPRAVVRWRIVRRPIALGPRRRDVLGVAAELEDVPLGDPQVLDQPPRGVRLPLRPDAPQCGRQALHRGVEVEVGIAAAQQIDQVPA